MKVAELPGDRSQVGLGQRPHHARALHRAHRRGHRGQALGDRRCAQGVVADERTAKGRERVGVVEIHHGRAVVHAGGEIDAHLLDDVAPHFRNIDLQHDLIAAAHDDAVDDLFGTADQPRRDVARLLRFDRAGNRTGQDDAFADAFDLDSRKALPERGTHAVEIALDRDVVGRDLPALGIEEHDIGLSDGPADDVGALGGVHHGIGDLRIRDQHVLDVAREVDHDGFADAEREKARLALPGGDLGCFVILTRLDRRHERIEHQRGNGRERQCADNATAPSQLICPTCHL